MDAFFASIEKQRREAGDTALVVGVYSGRDEDAGAVSTCDYVARDIGIYAGMSIKRAKQYAEDANIDVTFVPVDKEYYRMVSDRLRLQVLESYSDQIEQASVDEAYLDVSSSTTSFDELHEIAEEIQEAVQDEAGVTCSIGGGPNKLIAKIASDQDKPEGITIISSKAVDQFITNIELADIHGIGQKTIEHLDGLGISSIKELQQADRSVLVDEFGETKGVSLWRKAHGRDDESVEEQDQKQISRLTTLEANTNNKAVIEQYIESVLGRVADTVAERDVMFKRVVLLIVDEDNEMHTRSKTLPSPVQDHEQIEKTVMSLLEGFLSDTEVSVRRVGVRVADLSDASGQERLTGFVD